MNRTITFDGTVPDGPLTTDGDGMTDKCPYSAPVDDHHENADLPRLVTPNCPNDAATTGRYGRYSDIEQKYMIDPRVLGTGHHGSVRRCIDRATGEAYAVKSVRKMERSATTAGRLDREVSLLREMDHDGIVLLVDVFEDFEHVHLVTLLCEGGELFDKIAAMNTTDNGAACFPEDEAARIVHQILTAVLYMHERGTVHRDLKPENILFTTKEEGSPVKIIDFGLARKHNATQSAMTSIVGTPYYIAPEVLRQQYDKSCDCWSVGIITYLLLAGYPPFNGATNNEIYRSVLRGQYFFHIEDWKDISLEGMDFVHRLLDTDPRRRMTAEQALKHPWITKHVSTEEMMEEEKEYLGTDEEELPGALVRGGRVQRMAEEALDAVSRDCDMCGVFHMDP